MNQFMGKSDKKLLSWILRELKKLAKDWKLVVLSLKPAVRETYGKHEYQ